MSYTETIGSRTYRFADLKTLMAKASPLRSGDQLAGIAAASEEERVAAKIALANVPLRTFLSEALIPAAQLLPEMPSEIVDALTAGQIRQGRDFRVSPFRPRSGDYVKAISHEGDLIAIGEAKLPNVYHPILVL